MSPLFRSSHRTPMGWLSRVSLLPLALIALSILVVALTMPGFPLMDGAVGDAIAAGNGSANPSEQDTDRDASEENDDDDDGADNGSGVDEDELVENLNLIDSGLFQASSSAVRSRTLRGQTILDAPPFKTISRKDNLDYYPCSDCHEDEPSNPRERVLTEDHEEINLEHGGGRFWCLACHADLDKDELVTLKKLPINFDQPYLLCGQCHFQRQKDWYFGGHGKRVGAWQGQRIIRVCTECHDPHSPSIKPFKPFPPPQVRKGLSRSVITIKPRLRVWERTTTTSGKE